MDWLRCNKCYRSMKISKKTFSLTQCGHVYCNKCIVGAGTKCPECQTQNFTTMILSYPPKLEMTHNYFASLVDYMEIGIKTVEFQDNQLDITLRGFQGFLEKYEHLKKLYWNGMRQMNAAVPDYQKLQDETTKMEKFRDSLRKSRDERLTTKVTTNFSRREEGQQIQRGFRMHGTSGSTRRYDGQSGTVKFSMNKAFPNDSTMLTPQKTYNSNISFTGGAFNSDVYSPDSGMSSNPGTSSSRPGVFRVPNSHRVPRSVASLERKTPTRISEPKTGFTF